MQLKRAVTSLLFTMFLTSGLYAQVKVTFLLNRLPSGTLPGQVFLASNINRWQPADSTCLFNNQGKLTIEVKAGTAIQYKLTKGDWGQVETDFYGGDISNRQAWVAKDTSIYLEVEAWKNQGMTKPSTATPQVLVMPQPFLMESLQRQRIIRLYLPPHYGEDSTRYPVLYMQDGQNCFDNLTAPYGEWKVDETLDSIYAATGRSVIVVAIDHGETWRLTEYNPFGSERFGKGEGIAYCNFLVSQLKPYIDRNYRTLSNRENTWIAGSSMGGVISMYAVAAYPEVFGGAGIFSPAFWTCPTLFPFVESRMENIKGSSLFYYAGGSESGSMVPLTDSMYHITKTASLKSTKLFVDESAGHNEAAWAQWFPMFTAWMMRRF